MAAASRSGGPAELEIAGMIACYAERTPQGRKQGIEKTWKMGADRVQNEPKFCTL